MSIQVFAEQRAHTFMQYPIWLVAYSLRSRTLSKITDSDEATQGSHEKSISEDTCYLPIDKHAPT